MRVDMYEVSIVWLIAVAFSTLACLLVGPLFGLSFGKEAGEVIETPYLRDRSLPLVKVVSSIQIEENEIIMQSTDLFRATLRESLT